MTRTASLLLLLALALGALACVEDEKATSPDHDALVVDDLGAADLAFDPLQGELGFDDRQSAALTVDGPFHYWDLTVPEASAAFIDLASREGGDTYLLVYRLQNGRFRLFAYNDDCAGSLNSCWRGELPEGDYRLVVTSYGYLAWGRATTLGYELEVFCEAEGGTCGAIQEQLCGSRGLPVCPDGTYCDWDATGANACGATDMAGVCRPMPDACIMLYDPVCGCDGHTYGNGCTAASAGVDVAYQGECPGEGQGVGETCGGIATLQCADGLECDYSGNDSCHIADIGGVCVDTSEPTFCTEEYAPVCGCDGAIYDNDCFRRTAFVPLDPTWAACRGSEGSMCGGIAGFRCNEGLRCDYSANEACISDMAGVCVVDEVRACTREYRPVCGCDGRTYGNDCERRVAGVALDSLGPCGD